MAAAKVDREARDRAAALLRRFICGRVSNEDFEAGEPETADPAIRAIWSTAWLLYHDTFEHRLAGRYRVAPATKRECLRWILFLDSDRPYVWPTIPQPGADPVQRAAPGAMGGAVARLLGPLTGRLPGARVDAFLAAGDYDAWPFAKRADFRRALRHPRRLGGRARAA